MIKTKLFCFPFLFFLLGCGIFGCGIEDYPYIAYVPDDYISRELNNSVTIKFRDGADSSSFFTNYVIYYKIYISDIPDELLPLDNLENINRMLASDYNYIYPSLGINVTGSTTGTSGGGGSSTESLFLGRKYKTLELELEENLKIDDILNRNNIKSNTEVTIDFPQSFGEVPTLSITGISPSFSPQPPWRLLRSFDANPLPENQEAYFFNYPELYDSINISDDTVNTDIADKPDKLERLEYYTYVCMYIAAAGQNIQTYTPIYSAPTILHVMRLPDPR
jgi:hypothetical protein